MNESPNLYATADIRHKVKSFAWPNEAADSRSPVLVALQMWKPLKGAEKTKRMLRWQVDGLIMSVELAHLVGTLTRQPSILS